MADIAHPHDALPAVQVLLATYNGARFLRQQIDSVLAQEGVTVHILARDDGSNDGTQAVLAEYASAHPDRFQQLQDDKRTGTARGNFGLLLQATTGAYAAFCDQDDVWLPNKLAASMARMRLLEEQHGPQTPLLVYTDLRVVDEQLNIVSESLWQSNSLANAQAPALGGLLSENVVTGCTALLNRPLIDQMQTMPSTAQMHDHWAALIAAATGALAALPQSTVLYRQHGGNVIGAIDTTGGSIGQQFTALFGEDAVARRALQYRKDKAQANALLQLHGHVMSASARDTTEAFIALDNMRPLQRLRAMMKYRLWRNGIQRRITAVADTVRH